MTKERKNETIISDEIAFKRLEDYCRHDKSLSLKSLRKRINELRKKNSSHNNSNHQEKVIKAHGDGWTLLHSVCINSKVTLEIVKYLYDLYPEAVKLILGNDQRLPLHNACMINTCPFSVVKFLLSKYPEAVRIRWPHRGLPLHCYCSRINIQFYDYDKQQQQQQQKRCFFDEPKSIFPLNLQDLDFLIQLYPEAITDRQNNYQQTPLHLACERTDVSLAMVQKLVDPDLRVLALVDTLKNQTPIQMFFSSSSSIRLPKKPPLYDLVQYLIESSPAEDLVGAFEEACCCCCDAKYLSMQTIEVFLRRQPNLVEQANDHGNLPLHSLCKNENCHFDIIQRVCEAYPDAVQTTNNYGMLPLVYAVRGSLELVQYLVNKYPESVRETNFQGELAFHSACRYGSLEVVQYLFELHPKAVSACSISNDYPLHKAVEFARSDQVQVVRFLVGKYPEAVRKVGIGGDLPFNRACQSRPCLDLLVALFKENPAAIHTKDKRGRLPIHRILENFTKLDKTVTTFLHTQLPYGMEAKDNAGRLPLHYVCSNPGISLDALTFILELCPEAIKADSPQHGLPIHCMCKDGVRDLDVIRHLISVYPESLDFHNETLGLPLHCADRRDLLFCLLKHRYSKLGKRKNYLALHYILRDEKLLDKTTVVENFMKYFEFHARDVDFKGVTPLHLAVRGLVSFKVVKRLADLKPEAINQVDSQGSLPLHYALQYGATAPIVEYLILNYPDGCRLASYQNNLPIHLASRYGGKLGTVDLLLSHFPDGAKHLDNDGCTPLHVACRHGTSLEVTKRLISANPAAIHRKTKEGELPLHKACRGGRLWTIRLLLEKDMPSAGERTCSGMLPVFLLSQMSGKGERQDMFERPELVEMIWVLLKTHPEAIMSCSY